MASYNIHYLSGGGLIAAMSPVENFFVAIQGFSSYMYDTKQLAIAIMLWPTIEFHQNFVSNIIRKDFLCAFQATIILMLG